MRQIVVIHGGNSYESYEEFLSDLLKQVISLDWLHQGSWKRDLQDALGNTYEVIQPRMPNAQNAKYTEWKIWFEKYIPHLQDSVILLGHSLGGVFLAKYLVENHFPVKVRATFLVAAPYDEDGGKKLPEFILPESLQKFAEQGGDIHLYHSKDDPVVSFEELDKYAECLPNAHIHAFEDRQHFNQEAFPEIVEHIKALH
jgi:predicted alpha/beta hydrolase family esterase